MPVSRTRREHVFVVVPCSRVLWKIYLTADVFLRRTCTGGFLSLVHITLQQHDLMRNVPGIQTIIYRWDGRWEMLQARDGPYNVAGLQRAFGCEDKLRTRILGTWWCRYHVLLLVARTVPRVLWPGFCGKSISQLMFFLLCVRMYR